MASLYRDPKSPFWMLKFKSTDGKWRCKSLRPLRHALPAHTRQARAKRDQASLEEHSRGPNRDLWSSWVPAYLQSRYIAKNPASGKRVTHAWNNISGYLAERRIHSPQELKYRDCMDYMGWRTGDAVHNTAKLELSVLSFICDEAVRRGMIAANPATKLGIPKVRPKEKPELTDADIAKIRDGLVGRPEWMSLAFEIAIHQGCRLSETALFVSDIDLAGNRLHFRRTKGDKPFTVPINPGLKPKLEQFLGSLNIREENPVRLISLPANASRDFACLFKKVGVNTTFHSCRVTVASRLARSGYPISLAMRVLNHSSELIHKLYQKLQPADVAGAYDVLRYTQSSESPDSGSAT